MERLSTPTGGRALFTDSIDELHGAFEDLLDELSNQYLLGYPSTNSTRRRHVAAHQGRRRRPSRHPRAAGLPRGADQMSGTRIRRFVRPLGRRCAAGGSARHAAQQPPRFTSSVEVTSIDVDRRRRSRPADPEPGARRLHRARRRQPARVVSAEWVPLAPERQRPPAAVVPEGYSSNENATGGRLIVIAVDRAEHPARRHAGDSRAADAFIDHLPPSDRVAVVGSGLARRSTPFTGDRERVKRALGRMTGQRQARRTDGASVSVAEAQAIERGDRTALQAAQDRECIRRIFRNPAALEQCRSEVETEASMIAREERGQPEPDARRAARAAHRLEVVDAPKTLILISEGFVLDDPSYVIEVGSLAAAARTGLYALKLEREMFDASEGRRPTDAMGDRMAVSAGLDTLASAARGTRVLGHRDWRGGIRSHRIRALRVLPARRRIRCARSRRQAASGPRRRIEARRDRANASASRQCRRRGQAGAIAPRDRRGGTRLPVAALGVAGARRDVCAAGTRTDESAAADPCRHRQRLCRVASGVDRLHRCSIGRAISSTANRWTSAWRRS